MKKITFQLNQKNTEREDTAREILNAVSSVPKTGRFQVVIQNTPANTRQHKQLGQIRILAKTIAEHSKKLGKEVSPDDIYFLNKKMFAVDVMCNEDSAIKFQCSLFEQFASRATTDDQLKVVSMKRKAMIYAIIHLSKISESGLDEMIEKISQFWTAKGVNFNEKDNIN